MEYIDGQTLTERVKLRGVMDYREAFECLRPIMKALERIHAKHIVHRDVSPDNIMIRNGCNEPVLLDFGAAHRFTDENRSVSLRPGYAPPEQYGSLKLPDARSDEYALCTTFYYLLSGKKPLDANARKYSGEDIDPLIQLCPDMPIRFAQAIEKGMSLRIEDRFASVEELRSELERGLEKEKASPTCGRVALIAAGGVVALGVAAAALLMMPKNGQVVPNQETSIPTPTATTEIIETSAATETPPIPTETPVSTAPSSDEDGYIVVYARENVLMQVQPGTEEVVFSGASPVMGSEKIAREQISSIEFCAELPADIDTMLESGAAWDVSEAQNDKVLAWTGAPDESGRLPLYIGGDGGVVAPDACSALFSGFENVRRIDFNGCFDTRQVASMYAMFYDCASLQQLDMSSLKTNAATDMAFMFRGCASLEELDLSSFDTRQVTDMYAMFYGCKALRTLDVSSFAMGTVIDAGFMFGGCALLEELELSRFDTQNVTNIHDRPRQELGAGVLQQRSAVYLSRAEGV